MSRIEACGVWFYSISTNRYLYLLRCDAKYANHWALPGGKIEEGESLMQAISRECSEELGTMPNYIKLIPVEKFTANGGKFIYHTFFCLLDDEFMPDLNHEHSGYAWIDCESIPKPLHPGFWNTLNTAEVYNKINTIKTLYTSQCDM